MLPIVSLLVVGVLGLAACPDGGASGSDDTLPPPPPTTTTTALTYDVPAVIDVAYVERVMKALDHVYGDGVRHLTRSRVVDEEFLKHLLAIYTDREFRIAQDVWVRDVAAGLRGLRDVPGDPVTSVQRVVRSEAGCVVAAVAKDFQPTRSLPVQPTPQRYIALIPKLQQRDPAGLNPTPWTIAFDGYVAEPAGAEPEEPCAVS